MKVLNAAESVRAASDAILTGYERPADQGTAVQEKRAGYGMTYYEKYADTKVYPSDTLYKVQVGAYSKKENADAMLERVKAAGFTDAIIVVQGNESTTPATPAAEPVAPVFSPYKVKVTITDLNIRAGAGTNYDVTQVCPPGVYTIVEEKSGQGATMWGKLKSGVGWISLDYVKKL